jgi:ribonuclease HI
MNPDNKPAVIVYSDGGCKPNPGPGGWAALLIFREHQKSISGAEVDTTNNRMELTAAIKALEALNRPCSVTLHTDSAYLKNGITRWLKGWQKNNWRTSANKPVKNEDLWRSLQDAMERHEVQWTWVKGHAGVKWNVHVDKLATQAREALLRKMDDNSG